MIALDEVDDDDLIDHQYEDEVTEEGMKKVTDYINNITRRKITNITKQMRKKLDKDTLILDTGASVTIFKNERLFEALSIAKEPIFIDGANKKGASLLVDMIGKT